MPYISSGQSELYYESHGEGFPLVFAHGVGGNHASWFNQVPEFSKRYRTITFDHRGFGNSTDVEGAGRDAFVEDLAKLLDGLNIESAVLVAQSMGGGTAAAFTCRFPDRVRALVHCDSLAAVELDSPFATELSELNAKTLNFSQQERVLGQTTLRTDPIRTLLYLQIASFNSVNIKSLKGQPVRWSPNNLARTKVPVLFVVGEEDVICPPKFVTHMHDEVPGSKLVLIRLAGHSAYFEQPQVFNQVLMDYLQELGL